MPLEVGKKYKTRNGDIVEVLDTNSPSSPIFKIKGHNVNAAIRRIYSWLPNGFFTVSGNHLNDIISHEDGTPLN